MRRKRYDWTPEKDSLLREKYTAKRGAVSLLARALGVENHVVMSRLIRLGLCRPAKGAERRPWTGEENRLLSEYAGVKSTRWIAKKLGRSIGSIARQMERQGLRRAVREGYTQAGLQRCFGASHATIRTWWEKGQLRVRQDASAWRVDEAEVRRFIKANPTTFRLDKVDQLWFMDLMFGLDTSGAA